MLHSILRANDVMVEFLQDYFRNSLAYLDYFQKHGAATSLQQPMHWMKSWLDNWSKGPGGNPPATSTAEESPAGEPQQVAERIAQLEKRIAELEQQSACQGVTRKGQTMSTHNLSKIFHPRSVAVVGASSKPASVGRTVLENLQQAGFPGSIYPINPKYDSLLGLKAYGSIGELPESPDLAIIATPAPTVPSLVRECGEREIHGLIILSAGFREVGPAGQAIETRLAEEVAKFPDMRVVGPNCLGVLVPESRLNASFAAAMPQSGRIAFISQSGALCTSILDWSLAGNIGFSYFVSIGNALNVKVGDLIDYFAEDPRTDSIVLYVESVTEARRFMSAARAFTRTKPIVVYKAGRFAQSAAGGRLAHRCDGGCRRGL